MAYHGIPSLEELEKWKKSLDEYENAREDWFKDIVETDREAEIIKALTEPQVSAVTKAYGKLLMEEFGAITLSFSVGYDFIKYNFKLPVNDGKFESHKHKWQFIELAKHFENVKASRLQGHMWGDDYKPFLMWMYGEGFRKPEMMKTDWIGDIRNNIGLARMYYDWVVERQGRYDLLEAGLGHMKLNYNLNTIADFKEFITPMAVNKLMAPPLMWAAIGHNPVIRGNRTYSLTLQSFFLLDHYLHLMDRWNISLKGEPEWDDIYKRLSTYRLMYQSIYPINSMTVRQVINRTLKFP